MDVRSRRWWGLVRYLVTRYCFVRCLENENVWLICPGPLVRCSCIRSAAHVVSLHNDHCICSDFRDVNPGGACTHRASTGWEKHLAKHIGISASLLAVYSTHDELLGVVQQRLAAGTHGPCPIHHTR